jgi:hypothetical protein
VSPLMLSYHHRSPPIAVQAPIFVAVEDEGGSDPLKVVNTLSPFSPPSQFTKLSFFSSFPPFFLPRCSLLA